MAQAKKSQRRGSRVSTVSSKRGMEFTKKIVILTGEPLRHKRGG